MPPERKYDWALKTTSSTYFAIHKRKNGQFCVVLNHALLRGVTSEMIYWWFRHFQNIKVTLDDIEGYEGTAVPAYLLWHPSDHFNATLKGKIGSQYEAEAGDTIHIQEAMQYKKYGWKYQVDQKVKIFYCCPDGWAMGKKIPFLGEVMVLRIHFKDVVENKKVIGVHYHYEVVIGLTADHFLARQINKKVTAEFGPEFFEAWHLHNTIEVGVFENFLPALYAQRETINALHYSKDMNPDFPSPSAQQPHDKHLFDKRMQGYKDAQNPYAYQHYQQKTFL
ncbi:DAPG hydrolase family protein [Crocosphaera watsonii]|nr:hypothetical protein [Crocosphaera watsonii]